MNQRCQKCKIIFIREAGGTYLDACPVCNSKLEPALVPNFFSREDLADLVGEPVSKNQFENFIDEWEEGLADPISDLVRQSWVSFNE